MESVGLMILIVLIIILMCCVMRKRHGYLCRCMHCNHSCRCPNSTFSCECLSYRAATYYNNTGVWAGQYVMEPVKMVHVNDTTCDIKYKHYPLTSTGYLGHDYRRFVFQPSSHPSGWEVQSMGGFQSGVLAGP